MNPVQEYLGINPVQEYLGINPIQEDLDAYFGLQEEFGVKPSVTIKISYFQYQNQLHRTFSFIYLNGFYSTCVRIIKDVKKYDNILLLKEK